MEPGQGDAMVQELALACRSAVAQLRRNLGSYPSSASISLSNQRIDPLCIPYHRTLGRLQRPARHERSSLLRLGHAPALHRHRCLHPVLAWAVPPGRSRGSEGACGDDDRQQREQDVAGGGQ